MVVVIRIKFRLERMNCPDDESVCSVKKENNLGYYRLHTIWRKDRFFINITSKNGAWRGEMTPNDIAKISAQLEIEPESYLNQCKQALTHHGGQPGMVYAVENGNFEWKRVEDDDSGIKIKMGSVMLQPASFEETIQNLVTAALNCNKHLENKLKELTFEKEKVLENKNELENKLINLIKTKESMEHHLYARFILLINAKKKKIQELENLLEEQYKKRKSTGSRLITNPYEIDTENDSEEDIVRVKVRKVKRKASQKRERIKSSLALEPPEEKKTKNTDDDMSDYECLNYTKSSSPEPSTSKEESESTGREVKMGLQDASTKDELYNYFYGEL